MDNFLLLKAIEKIDSEENNDNAITLISDPNLDRKELANILENSLMGKFVNKNTGESLQLSNKTFLAGCLNMIKGFENDMRV